MVFKRIQAIISSQLNIPENELTPHTSFRRHLNVDSLDVFQIIMEIEREFDVDIPAHKIKHIKNIEDIVEYIKLQKGLD
ncbi:MAG: acyl carrier protein [Epulopiscium sp. Nele67-Bin005]|nr:MAG: acyl carrier protein [Epulopiscium sp. Nele67-Bin005]